MNNSGDYDPRLGFTSASNAEADGLCPGRHLAQRGLKGYDTKDSTAGTLVHGAFAGTIPIQQLSTFQQSVVAKGKIIEWKVAQAWFKEHGIPISEAEVEKRAQRELRLWAYYKGQRIHSGGIDALWLCGDMKHALIGDLKSLFGEVEEAPSNKQLRDYAALVYLNYGCETVTVYINQPAFWKEGDDLKMVRYNAKQLRDAAFYMEERVLASNNLKAERKPGEKQCRFCLAAGTDRCGESLRALQSFGERKVLWNNWTPKERGEFLLDATYAQRLAAAVYAEAKQMLRNNPTSVAGWQVTKDTQTRKLKDGHVADVANTLVDAFSTKKVPAKVILAEVQKRCSLSIGDLEEVHSLFTEMDNPKDARAEFNVLFEEWIEKTVRLGSLRQKNTEGDEPPF